MNLIGHKCGYQNLNSNLPINEARVQIMTELSKNKTLIIVGDTGSGKSTQITKLIYNNINSNYEKICCTQPRRIAAMTVSKRVSYELNCKLGSVVGYIVRFENLCSNKTVIKYVTEGILLNEITTDIFLLKYKFIVVDEAHERTVNTDLILGLIKELLKVRKNFRIIIMSATLEINKFFNFFKGSTIILIPGRLFPVQIFFTKFPIPDYMSLIINLVNRLCVSKISGSILIFLTGEEEIEELCILLKEKIHSKFKNYEIHPLYSNLSLKHQEKIFEKRILSDDIDLIKKIIASTNIAETSVTIENIIYVIDSGFSKKKIFNPRTKVESLIITPISKASAHQRTGRAGRIQKGRCFRLYTESSFYENLSFNNYPEMIRCNLTFMILILKKMGIDDIVGFDFIDPPLPETLMRGLEILYYLNALDYLGLLTKYGLILSEIPLEPQSSKTLVESYKLGVSNEMVTILGMISCNYILYNQNAHIYNKISSKFKHIKGDHLTMLNIYHAWRIKEKNELWAEKNLLNYKLLESCDKIRFQLIKKCKKIGIKANINQKIKKVRFQLILNALLVGFFLQISFEKNGIYKTLFEGNTVFNHPLSFYKSESKCLLYNELIMTNKLYMCVVSPINLKWIFKLKSKIFKNKLDLKII